ncbi:MAG TPA: alpha/beta hydrolase, partial [Minicystis sp.]|nr:alpha/beta hydrolase [Minicystis sp.]
NRQRTVLRLASGPAVTVAKDLVYVPGSANPKHRLDVYAPPGAHGAPVVHFIHGGYWTEGDKDYLRAITGLYGSVGVALARRGVVTFVQSYRLAPEVDIDGMLDDVLAAIRFTEQHAADYGGDPARVFVMGHSAGGHLAAMIATDPELQTRRGMEPNAIRGFIPISAVWDIEGMHGAKDEAFNERVTYRVFRRDPARWARYSPLARLAAGAPPMLVMIGTRDTPFMIPEAERAHARLTALGARHRFVSVEGNDHEAMVLRFGAKDDDMTDAVVDFVTKPP